MRRAYNRATYIDERRAMMQQWADMSDAQKQVTARLSLGRLDGPRHSAVCIIWLVSGHYCAEKPADPILISLRSSDIYFVVRRVL